METIIILATLATPFIFLAYVAIVFVSGTRANKKAFAKQGYYDFSKAWVSPNDGKLYRYNIKSGMIVRAPENAPRMYSHTVAR